jgi:hypothetical protein
MQDSFVPDKVDSFEPDDDGLIEPGNIDLYKQPKVKNPQGGTSTVFSRGFNFEGQEVLLPSVTPDGRFLESDDDVVNEYKKTGRHLGKFRDVDSSNRYAEQLHKDYESGKYNKPLTARSMMAIGHEVNKPKPNPPIKPFQSHDSRGFIDKALGRNIPNDQRNLDSFGLPTREDNSTFSVDTSGMHEKLNEIGGKALDYGVGIPVELAIGALSDPMMPLGVMGAARSKFSIEGELPAEAKLVEPATVAKPKLNDQFDLPLDTAPVSNIIGESAPEMNAVRGTKWVPPEGNTNYTPETSYAMDTLLQRLRGAKVLNKAQRDMYKVEHAQRANKVENASGSGGDWARNVKGSLKGEYEKVPDFTPIELTTIETDSLLNVIKDHPSIAPFEKARGIFALEKMVGGKIPQRNEILLLERIYGPDLARELLTKRPRIGRNFEAFNDFSKEIMSSMDMSAPLRQGLPLIHRKEWWTSLDDMVKAWGSERAAKAIDASIAEMPEFAAMRQGGLSLSDTTSITNREERFMSRFASRIPGVKQSERAYVGFLNKLRADTFSSMYKAALKTGANPEDAAYRISKFVNVATGRGELGTLAGINLEKHADALNKIFFSPRFMASRFNMLKPEFYIKQPAYIRREALKSLASVATAIGTANALGALAGAELEKDPRSTDSGKVKFGKTRIDPGGSFIQPIVMALRIATGKVKGADGRLRDLNTGDYGSRTKKDVVESFFRNKLGPSFSFIYDNMEGTDAAGDKVTVPKEIISRFSPMFLQDVYDVMQEDDDYAPEMPSDKRELLAIPGSFFGAGSQSYR